MESPDRWVAIARCWVDRERRRVVLEVDKLRERPFERPVNLHELRLFSEHARVLADLLAHAAEVLARAAEEADREPEPSDARRPPSR
jgi:hypothetical protein